MSTPVQRQYKTLKDQNPDAILFFQLGDFYEMFHEDAVLVSRVLGLTLTARHRGSENEMPMCGFPMHAHAEYLQKLIESGYKVAIADQSENPETKQIDRKITRVITPGTSLEEGIKNPDKSIFLAAIIREKKAYGLAFSDLSTGEFRTVNLPSEKSFIDEIHRINPQEILIAEDLFLDEKFCSQLPKALLTIRKASPAKSAANFLQTHFGVQNLTVFGIEKIKLLIMASAMVLQYLKDTQKADLSHITKLTKYSPHDIMILDAQTMRHLEIFQPIRFDENSATLLSVFQKTHTPMGGRKLRNWIAHPLLSIERIKTRHDAVEELHKDIALRQKLKIALTPISDLERILARLVTDRGNGRDLAFFRDSFQSFLPIKTLLANSNNSTLQKKSESFNGFEKITEKLEKALVELPPLEITQGGIFREEYNPELDELKRVNENSEKWLENFLEQKKTESGIPSLKIKYSKNFGYCLEVSNAHKSKIPSDWIRRQTLVNAERLTTPELSEYENKILNAQAQMCEYEHKLFHELKILVTLQTKEIQQVSQIIGELDVLLTFAFTALNWKWNKPEIMEGNANIYVEEGRHPVIEKLSTVPFISNHLKMGSNEQHLHLITGPNMAGKSTFLRQNALIILLAQIGSFVPAKKASLGIFDRIFTRVGASDNLAGGQSTFFVEMMETSTILNSATERSFIILDEIGRGTSTFDGISLAWAITEYIHNTIKAKTLFATHYHELIDLANNLSHATNYHVSVAQNKDGIVFLRRIIPGGISDSFGIEVAASAGLPKPLILNAREILQRLESENLLQEPNLFSIPRVREKIIEIKEKSKTDEYLEKINPNDLSPKNALDIIFELKDLINKTEKN